MTSLFTVYIKLWQLVRLYNEWCLVSVTTKGSWIRFMKFHLKNFHFYNFFNFSSSFFFQFRFLCHNSWISYWIALVVTVECVRHFYHRMKIKTDTCLSGIQKCQVSKSSHFQLHLLSVGHLVKQFYDEHISINF